MTPEEMDSAARRKYKRDLKKTAQEEGLEEVILDMAVDLKVNSEQDKCHQAQPLHKAHPVTKETIAILVGAVLAMLVLGGILTPEQAAAAIPFGGG